MESLGWTHANIWTAQKYPCQVENILTYRGCFIEISSGLVFAEEILAPLHAGLILIIGRFFLSTRSLIFILTGVCEKNKHDKLICFHEGLLSISYL